MTKFKLLLLSILLLGCKKETNAQTSTNETKEIVHILSNDTLSRDVSIDSLEVKDRETFYVLKSKVIASYYGKSHHGKKMANGKPFNMYNLTCAHKKLPFGTKVRVTNLKNGKSVILTVTDRGPYKHGRELDLSRAAYSQITHDKKAGLLNIKLEVLKK